MQFKINEAVEILAETPRVLDTLLREKSAAWLTAKKAPDAFSAIDVLGHLMHGERTDWIPRLRIMLEDGEARAFEPFDRFGFQDLIAGKSIEELLDEFAEMRRTSLDALADLNLAPEQLRLTGTHPEFGRVTMENLLATWAVHDLGHIAQIVRTMACEYREAVGPWRAYTPILN